MIIFVEVSVLTGSEDGLVKQWGASNGELIHSISVGARVTGLVVQVC